MGLLWVSGLLWLNPGGLRQLIFADRSPGLAVAPLMMSFVITFGSTAMGTAIMTLGQRERDDKPPRGQGPARAAMAAPQQPVVSTSRLLGSYWNIDQLTPAYRPA